MINENAEPLGEEQLGVDDRRIPLPPWKLDIPAKATDIEELLISWSKSWPRDMFRTVVTEQQTRYTFRPKYSHERLDIVMTLSLKTDGTCELLVKDEPDWGNSTYFYSVHSLINSLAIRLHTPVPNWGREESILWEEFKERSDQMLQIKQQELFGDQGSALRTYEGSNIEEDQNPRWVTYQAPPLPPFPWQLDLPHPYEAVRQMAEYCISLLVFYAAEAANTERGSLYRIVSTFYEPASAPTICLILIVPDGEQSHLTIEIPADNPSTQGTRDAFLRAFAAQMKFHNMPLPGIQPFTEPPTMPLSSTEQRTKQTYEDAKAKLEALQRKEPVTTTTQQHETTMPQSAKRRRGGKKVRSPEQRRAIVDRWLRVQDHELQETYCATVGISSSTLRAWIREFYS